MSRSFRISNRKAETAAISVVANAAGDEERFTHDALLRSYFASTMTNG